MNLATFKLHTLLSVTLLSNVRSIVLKSETFVCITINTCPDAPASPSLSPSLCLHRRLVEQAEAAVEARVQAAQTQAREAQPGIDAESAGDGADGVSQVEVERLDEQRHEAEGRAAGVRQQLEALQRELEVQQRERQVRARGRGDGAGEGWREGRARGRGARRKTGVKRRFKCLD